MRPLRCWLGLHSWAPDYDRGFPYIKCDRCGREDFYEPL